MKIDYKTVALLPVVAGALWMALAMQDQATAQTAPPAPSRSPSPQMGETLYMKPDYVGCRHYQTLERLRNMLARDREGFPAMFRQVLIGECIMWKDATRVRMEERGPMLSYTNCYAEFGSDRPCYWTSTDAIRE